MGLAGRKTKQRIGADPRNLTWSDDTTKFGAKYLQSLGWTSGTGLGISGEGRSSNLKVHQKLDLMGIGANRRGPDGNDANWRGGREFEGLLARLNQAQNADTQDIPTDEAHEDNHDSTVNDTGRETTSAATKRSPEVNDDSPEPSTTGAREHKEKRKRCMSGDEEVDAKGAKRRRKEEKREKKKQKKAEKAAMKLKASQNTQSESGDQAQVAAADVVREQGAEAKVTRRYRAHRARNIASKRLAAVSATGMNEILGISSSSLSGPKMEISSIPFPTLNPLPLKHLVQGEDQSSTPGFRLSFENDHSEQALEADDTSVTAMSLGSHSAPSRGLGFRREGEKTATPKKDGNDLLRKSGKSVAEYFAEKLRSKRMSTFANTQRRTGKKLENIS